LAKLRRTAKRPTLFLQLATNTIDPHHFKEHLFFDPFWESDFGQKYSFFSGFSIVV